MKEFLIEHSGEELEYDDSLVRKLIRKIVVNRHSLTIEFKSGDEVEINI
jgi:hypothetical protein